MGTTLIIVELVIIGFQVLVWVALLLWPVLDPKYICFDQLKDWVSVAALSVLAVAYTLGIVCDRFLGFLTSTSCFQWLISKFEWLRSKLKCDRQNSQTGKPTSTRYHYAYMMLKHIEVYKQWEYIDRRIRLLRATSVNAFLIVLIGCFRYGLWLYWRFWLPLFILAILSALTWCYERSRSDNALARLHKMAKRDEKAKKQQGPKAV